MKKSLLLLLFTTGFVSYTICYGGDIIMQSQWRDSLIDVDGNPKDWGESPMAYFKQANVSLGVMNDSDYMYFTLNFKDQSSTKFLQSNVTLWLDKTEKNKKEFGVRYHGCPPQQENNVPDSVEKFHPMLAEMQDIIRVINKKDTLVLRTADGNHGFKVATSYQQGFYCHEIRIPIEQSDSIPYIFGASLGKTISVGAELGMNFDEFKGMRPKDGERPEMPGGMPPGGGMQGGGMDRGPGMGGGNNPGNPPSPNNGVQMPKKQEFWIKINLARSSQTGQENPKENK